MAVRSIITFSAMILITLLAVAALCGSADADTIYSVDYSCEHGELTAYCSGEVLPSGSSVGSGANVRFEYTPDPGYESTSWIINGTPTGCTYQAVMELVVTGATELHVASTYYSQSTFENYGYTASVTADSGWAFSWTYGTGTDSSGSMNWTNMVHSPAVMGGYVYTKLDNYLVKLDASTGEELVRVKTSASFSGYYEAVTVGNGYVLDCYTGKVFDADLEQVFVLSQTGRTGYYHEGLFIIQSGTTDTVDAVTYCFSALDADPYSPDNKHMPLWSFVTGAFHGKYYGGSTILFGDGFMLIAGVQGDDIIMRTLGYADGSVIDTCVIDELKGMKVSKGYINLEGGYATLAVMKPEGSTETFTENVAIAEVGTDGLFGAYRTFKVGQYFGNITSLITVGSYGYILTEGVLHVYDLGTLDTVADYSAYSKQLAQVHGNMSVTVRDDGSVDVWVVPYQSSDCLYLLHHDPSYPSVISATVMEGAALVAQFSYQQAHFTEDGSVIYINDSGRLFCVSSCEKAVESVVLSDASLEVYKGSTKAVTATVSPHDASSQTVRWTSSNTKVATVSETGVIKAVGKGICVIRATARDSGGVYAECKVTVLVKMVESIDIGSGDIRLASKGTVTLTATVSPADASLKTVTWSTSDSSIATVTSTGKVTAVNKGMCIITAKAKDGSGVTAQRVVKVDFTDATGLEMSVTEMELAVGENYMLTAIVTPDDATIQEYDWSVSDPAMATCEDGFVKALSAGICTVTATTIDGTGLTATCSITVTSAVIPVDGVSLSPSELALQKGESSQLTATVSPADASVKTVIWDSANPAVAVVGADGNVAAVGPGSTVITVTTTDGGFTATCSISVTVPVTGVELDMSEVELVLSQSMKLTATVSPQDASEKGIMWSSSDESVATVGDDGVVTAVGKGSAVVTVATVDGGFTDACSISVVVPVTGVELDISQTSLILSQSMKLTATVSPQDASDKGVTWSSSDESVVTVDLEGKVTAVGAGSAVVTVTTVDGGFTSACSIAVTVPVAGISLDESSIGMDKGQVRTLHAAVSPSDATDLRVVWSSDNAFVASVSESGDVVAKGAGTATITATAVDGGFTATCSITVTVPVTGISFTSSTMELKVSQTCEPVVVVSPSDATCSSFVLTSSDPSVVSVSGTKVTGISEGTAVLTATSVDGGLTATCSITVVSDSGGSEGIPVVIYASGIGIVILLGAALVVFRLRR